ncbi:MAG TPA: T9SS type A sorting domain-containing protein [Bacteroidia bacterium]|nr:T9SS type A sorting domain-containing protein [Bacteroidia bacterium]
MINKFILPAIFSFILFSVNAVDAQYAFQRLIGGSSQERGQALFQTLDGGYLYNGATLSYGSGSADGFFVKTNSQGLLEWAKAYGTVSFDNSEFAIQAHDGSLLGVGRTFYPSGLASDVLLFKTDSSGNLLWSKTYGGGSNEGVAYMIETGDHGYALVGATQSTGAGSDDILFIRTDENGDTLFTRTYGTVESEVGIAIQEAPDGSFVICGKQTIIAGGLPFADAVLMRTDASGNLVWANLYGDTLWEELESVRIAADGDLVSCGSITSFGAGKYDILCMRTDSLGNVDWAKTYGGAETDASYGVLANADDTYTLSGYTNSLGYGHEVRGDDSTNIFLMKINSLGDTLWTRTYGDGLQDEAYRNSAASDGGYLVSGFTTNYAFQDSAQMILIKTDSLGFTGCHEYTSYPVVSTAPLSARSVSFAQSAGLIPATIALTELSVNTNDEDACLYTETYSEPHDRALTLYPNPFYSRVTIVFPEDDPVREVVLSDLQGRKVYHWRTESGNQTGRFEMNLGSLSPGIYLTEVLKSSGERTTLKLIRQ